MTGPKPRTSLSHTSRPRPLLRPLRMSCLSTATSILDLLEFRLTPVYIAVDIRRTVVTSTVVIFYYLGINTFPPYTYARLAPKLSAEYIDCCNSYNAHNIFSRRNTNTWQCSPLHTSPACIHSPSNYKDISRVKTSLHS